jgi:hypothetical protein
MAAKMIDWFPEVAIAMDKLKTCDFPTDMTFPLIDYLASCGIIRRPDLLKWARDFMDGVKDTEIHTKTKAQTWTEDNFVSTTLANVTMTIHSVGGDVPDPGGWYFKDKKLEMYLLDRGFGAAWKEVRSKDAISD